MTELGGIVGRIPQIIGTVKGKTVKNCFQSQRLTSCADDIGLNGKFGKGDRL